MMRRKQAGSVTAAALGCAVPALLAFAPTGTAPTSWPQSYHDGGHTGWNRTESTLSSANVANLTLKWGQGVNCGTVAFALTNGTIYARGQGSDCGTHDLEAIDAAAGIKKWTIVLGQSGLGISETVSTFGALVVTGCSQQDGGGGNYGAICAYRQADGKSRWTWGVPCNCAPESSVKQPVAYANGAVYFGYGNGGGTCAGDINYIVAADAASGSTLWTYNTGDCNSLDGSSTPAVAGGHVYFSANKSLYAVSQTDGSLAWSVPFGGASETVQISVMATGNAVYAVAHNLNTDTTKAVALDAVTGNQNWVRRLPSGDTPPPAYANGLVYVRAANRTLYALNATTGAIRWSTSGVHLDGSASIANKVIYIGGGFDTGRTRAASAYDVNNGNLLWMENSGDDSTLNPPPVVADGILYIANDTSCGSVCAFALP